jgi:hypothetical protein
MYKINGKLGEAGHLKDNMQNEELSWITREKELI